MKYRTISKAYDEIKLIDPNTDITPYLIRKLANQNLISLTRTGTKTLVDVDSILAYLHGDTFTPVIRNIA